MPYSGFTVNLVALEIEEKMVKENVFFMNVRSLRSHSDQRSLLVASLIEVPMILALCETWLTDNDPTILYSSDGFSKIENVNRKNKKGGGLAFFARKSFDFKTRVFDNPLEHFVISIIDNSAIFG